MENKLSLTRDDRRTVDLSTKIKGWGADLEPSSRPGVPFDKAPDVGIESLYPDIEPQLSDVEILKSVEHRQMPPVFGTTCPPSGLSGVMRRFAFKYSEGEFTHWLMLIAADRVNMIEDVLKDLSKGHIPNLYKEMGLASEWKYNRKKFLGKIAVAGLAVGAVAGIVAYRRRQKALE